MYLCAMRRLALSFCYSELAQVPRPTTTTPLSRLERPPPSISHQRRLDRMAESPAVHTTPHPTMSFESPRSHGAPPGPLTSPRDSDPLALPTLLE